MQSILNITKKPKSLNYLGTPHSSSVRAYNLHWIESYQSRVVCRAGDSPQIHNLPPNFGKNEGRSLHIWHVIYTICIECPLFSEQSPLFWDIEGDFPLKMLLTARVVLKLQHSGQSRPPYPGHPIHTTDIGQRKLMLWALGDPKEP